jgi:ribA/ribD-fused uncharacterized protein
VIKEDLPFEMEQNMRKLAPIYHNAKDQNMKATLNRDTLRINGEKFTVNNLDRLPESLNPKKLSMNNTEDTILFWGKDSYLSNHNTEFPFMVNGVRYHSVEQYYCAQRAKFFDDKTGQQRIMSTTDPIIQKRVSIKGYNEKEWQLVAESHMMEGLRHKFNQSHRLKTWLLETGNKIIGEASPYDSYWGLGMRMSDKEVHNRSKWGKNRLGTLIMKVRQEMKM